MPPLDQQLVAKLRAEDKARSVFALVIGVTLGLAITSILKSNYVGFLICLLGNLLAIIGWSLAFKASERLAREIARSPLSGFRYPGDLRDKNITVNDASIGSAILAAIKAPHPVPCTSPLFIFSPEAALAMRTELVAKGMTWEAGGLTIYGVPAVVDQHCPVYGLFAPTSNGGIIPERGLVIIEEPRAAHPIVGSPL